MRPLLDTILDHIEAPEADTESPVQILVSSIDYNEYVGRIGVGKVENGILKVNQEAIVLNHHEPEKQAFSEAAGPDLRGDRRSSGSGR